jgi:concentrative nucleoside transporter, CNT family
MLPQPFHALLGYAGFMLIAWLCGERHGRVPWRTVAGGIVLQLALAMLLLKVPALGPVLAACNEALSELQRATEAGTQVVFGYLGGAPLPFASLAGHSSFVLAFQALPIVLVMSALSALLFHWRILPPAVRAFSWVLEKLLGVGGAVGLSTAANVFLGMVEAPLLIRPYLARVSRGELFVTMSAGMAGVAGSVMALYAGILAPRVPDALGHILVASFISAPAAIVFSVLMVPPMGAPTGSDTQVPRLYANSMDAITQGTGEGLQLLLNIVAMLIVLIALVAIGNAILGLIPAPGGTLTLQTLLGWVLTPLAWLAGVPWSEAAAAGSLLGTKIVLNELIAYLDMAAMPAHTLSPSTRIVMTYALCGFANLGSLGILLGGLTSMVPQRRAEIVALAPRTLVAGTLATLSCGSLVSAIL